MGVYFGHEPVMPDECVRLMRVKKGGAYLDCTVGGGGHSARILKETGGECQLIGIDRDESAVLAACAHLKRYMSACTLVHGNFADFAGILDNLGINKVDGALIDLGVSSFQLDTAERGFSYMKDAPLDMRMDTRSRLTAKDVVNGRSAKELERIFLEYGEERFARRIAQRIERERLEKSIETTFELVGLIRAALPPTAKNEAQHPAKRVFQALRIAVNDELGTLERTLPALVERLNPGGVLCVITFHSLEDRIVKSAFKKAENPCECPRDFPRCVCGKVPTVKILTRKPVLPTAGETEKNPRARSAKVRAVEKI